jgi:hypothetical protein
MNYDLESMLDWNNIFDTGQTTGYDVFIQGYRSGAENFVVYAWNFDTDTWVSKTTIQASSDTNYNFALNSDEYDSVHGWVLLQFKGSVLTADTTRDTLFIDLISVSQKHQGYGLDIDMTSTTVPTTGDIVIAIKGKTNSEQFDISIWNYTSNAWDVDKTSVSATTNTWSVYDLHDTNHRSTTNVSAFRRPYRIIIRYHTGYFIP